MASGDPYQHVTVSTSVVTVTLNASSRTVEVLNRSGAGEIYFTTDGSTPTVGGNCRVVPASPGAFLRAAMEGGGGLVKLIASASTTVSVSVME
jgi:hypothetical protein